MTLDLFTTQPEMPMIAEAEILPPETASTDIVLAVQKDPGIVLLDNTKFSVWYEKLKADAPTNVDIATNKGRDALRSYAADVRKEKAEIKRARLRLTEGWRDATAQANAAGKVIDEQLEKLAIEVRAPLTAWEEAEEARVAKCRAVIDGFKRDRIINEEDTAATVRARGLALYETAIDEAEFGDMFDEAVDVKDDAIAVLKRALGRLTQEEADRAELAKLRAAALEREQAEAEHEAERVAVEQEEARKKKQADDEVAAAEAERERIAAAAEKAAQDARVEAERKAQAEIDAANERVAKIERERQDEIDRLAKEKAAADAEAKRIADGVAALEADEANRSRVKTAAKLALMTCGIDEEAARKIVLAIIAKEIPNVTMAFGQ
jgi:colicin import membrane protein